MSYIRTDDGVYEVESKLASNPNVYKTTNHYYFYGSEVKNESENINDLVDVYILKNSEEVKSWTKSYDELVESVIDDPAKYQVYGCVCAGDEGLKFVSKIVASKYGVNETLINI